MLKIVSFVRSVSGRQSALFLKKSSSDITQKCFLSKLTKPSSELQKKCDVLIIGGGGFGSSSAYWLKKRAGDSLNVVVIEKDCTYTRASTPLSVGGLRQQFSCPENIQMSLYGAEFFETIQGHLGDCELNFRPNGYLLLASENGASTLLSNSKLQNELGARNEVLTPEKLKLRYPWINTDGIALGCIGIEKEGWFDPWALLMGFKNTARQHGANYVDGEVIEFGFEKKPEGQKMQKAVVKLTNGDVQSIEFGKCVIAAGACSGQVGKLAGMGTGTGLLSTALPVEPRKRFVYVFDCQGENAPGLKTPLTIDTNGTYFRRDGEGGNYLCGKSPDCTCEPPVDDLEVDFRFFEDEIWPTLAHRVKAFESVKVRSSWAGFYEYNTFDENGIIGRHPYYDNVFIATGFSGHGIQQTPAVGRAIAELIIDGKFKTIDLTRLGFDRIINGKPMPEVHIY
ncbi:FAD-dependent oxidoreductase domain-containing protein 1 [Eupeodes corollae]|uniref:FAD-dependent oxidoreductase domain-containing protein 1 n=1 Tax=Eupeodes corollae TaxID=290404 RepID=UPI00248FB325|nr:FAD-dependent oxidoreductase domain-containing protein 1 [Eupeodes corollae]